MKKNFGKYAILSPVKYTLKQEPDWWWMIEPPTSSGDLEIAKLLATDKTRIDIDGSRISQFTPALEVAMREIAVTFGGTNIPASETSDEPVLKKGATVAEIEDVLKEMPRALVVELWEAVGEAVPGWGPKKPAGKPAVKDADAANEENEAKN